MKRYDYKYWQVYPDFLYKIVMISTLCYLKLEAIKEKIELEW